MPAMPLARRSCSAMLKRASGKIRLNAKEYFCRVQQQVLMQTVIQFRKNAEAKARA